MAQKKISELTAATVVNDADLIPIVQSGETKKAPASLLASRTVATVRNLPQSPSSGVVYQVAKYISTWQSGGCAYVYMSGVNKNTHNGVTVIDPGVISSLDGTSADFKRLAEWSPSGSGVYIAIGRPLIAGETAVIPTTTAGIKIADAMDLCRGFDVAADAILKITAANGSYSVASTISLNHHNGDRVQLVGNVADRSLCVLSTPSGVAPTYDLMIASNGSKFGLVDGFTINLAAKALAANNFTAILSLNGADINVGENVYIDKWYYGVAARNGSSVIANGVDVNDAGDVGIWAYNGSFIQCNNATSNNAADVANNLGFGIQAEFGSSVECTAASASGCRIGGIASLSNSVVRAHNAIASNNTGSGFYASADGHIEHHGATANNNTRYGEERVLGGTIVGGSVTLSGNTLGSANGYAYFDNSGPLGARLAANGNLRIDVNGANEVYFNSSGGVQSQITHTASANSWPLLRASSANQPGIEPGGSASNIDYNVRAKGTGRVFVGSHRANFVSVDGSSSGGGTATLRPEGSDANIDLILQGKGGGLVRWGIHTSGAVTPNGYVEWKLEDGVVVRVAAERL